MRSDLAELHPLSPWLRWRVARVRAGTRCRIFPALVEVVPSAATPGSAAAAAWEYAGEAGDHALRVDVLVRLLSGRPGPLTVVHVRPGRHDRTDRDMGWAAAGRVASDIAGLEVPTAVAVSRWGWTDLTTGVEKSWRRLRIAATD